jgi:hypothetical protein
VPAERATSIRKNRRHTPCRCHRPAPGSEDILTQAGHHLANICRWEERLLLAALQRDCPGQGHEAMLRRGLRR